MTIYLVNNAINTIRTYLPSQTGYTLSLENPFTGLSYQLYDTSEVSFYNAFVFDLTGGQNFNITSIVANSGEYWYKIINPDGITIADQGKLIIIGEKPIIPVVSIQKKKIKITKV